MLTFCPADVVSVKLDLDTFPIVPEAPPAAGPDRAWDPPPDTGWAAEAGAEFARPMESPITEHIIVATAMIRRTLGRAWFFLTRLDSDEQAGRGSGAAAEPPTTEGVDLASDMGLEGRVP